MKYIWKKNFFQELFWVPVPFKQYENKSGCGTDFKYKNF